MTASCRWLRAPLAALGVSLVALLPAASRSEPVDRQGVCIFAQVRAVDPGGHKLTASVQYEDHDDPAEHTLTLPKDVGIALVAKPQASLKDLKPAMRIAVLLSADERTVQAIREWKSLGTVPADQQPGVVGILKSADWDKRRLTVTIQEENRRPALLTLAVSSSVTVMLKNKQAAQPDQLKAGMRVLLALRDADSKVRAISEIPESTK